MAYSSPRRLNRGGLGDFAALARARLIRLPRPSVCHVRKCDESVPNTEVPLESADVCHTGLHANIKPNAQVPREAAEQAI